MTAVEYEIVPGDHTRVHDWTEEFGRDAPLKLELGPGKGEFLAEVAAREPECNVVAIELRRARIPKVIQKSRDRGLTNVRVIRGDAMVLVPGMFADDSLAEIWMNFPDPWPKKRHARRRMVQLDFLRVLAAKLAPNAPLTLVTDHPERAVEAEEAFAALEESGLLRNPDPEGRPWVPRLDGYPETIHERKFREWGDRDFHFFRRVRAGG